MGLSLITKGMLKKIVTIETARIYYPITVSISDRKPTITLRPIKKKIHLDVKCGEE